MRGPSLRSAYGHASFPAGGGLAELALETCKCLCVVRVLPVVNSELEPLLGAVPAAPAQPQPGSRDGVELPRQQGTVPSQHLLAGDPDCFLRPMMYSQSPCDVPSWATCLDHGSSLFGRCPLLRPPLVPGLSNPLWQPQRWAVLSEALLCRTGTCR